MLYTIKRQNDNFSITGNFQEIKKYFNMDEPDIEDFLNEDAYEDQYALYQEFQEEVDYMENLLDVVNKRDDSGMDFYIDFEELDIASYVENANGGEPLSLGQSVQISVDGLTMDEIDHLDANNFIGYNVILNKTDSGNYFEIESFVDSPISQVVTATEAAEILGISERGVQKNCESGKYICRKSGRIWIIDRNTL